jgi:hypothetical protein
MWLAEAEKGRVNLDGHGHRHGKEQSRTLHQHFTVTRFTSASLWYRIPSEQHRLPEKSHPASVRDARAQ